MAAPGNAYPAVLLDSRGEPADSGVTLQFTDDANQPGTGGGSQPVVESYITELVTLTTGGDNYDLTSVDLQTGTWLITARTAVFSGGPLASVDVWVGPNSAAATDAYAGSTTEIGSLAGGAENASLSITKAVVLAEPTTVYLTAQASEDDVVAECKTPSANAPAVTGITAVGVA